MNYRNNRWKEHRYPMTCRREYAYLQLRQEQIIFQIHFLSATRRISFGDAYISQERANRGEFPSGREWGIEAVFNKITVPP